MKISGILLLLGIMFVIIGYTHQISPTCEKKEFELKLVNDRDFRNININKDNGISASHQGSSPLF